jgi:hypothetical protein
MVSSRESCGKILCGLEWSAMGAGAVLSPAPHSVNAILVFPSRKKKTAGLHRRPHFFNG